MKGLVIESHRLAVPDERAAIEAASAWLTGDSPRGRPYEAGADTSKIAMGGVCGQCVEDGGELRVLLYWSAPLSASQAQWHPFEQEFYGLLGLKRGIVEYLGRIPIVMFTDHGSASRSHRGKALPLAR